MWWDRSKSLEVHLAERGIGIGASATAPARWFETRDLDDSLRHLAAHLESDEGRDVRDLRVWLSGSLARPFVLAAGTGARNAREARTLASARACDVTGLPGAPRVWLDRWRGDAATLCVAMPEAAWNGLHAMLDSVGQAHSGAGGGTGRRRCVRLASVRPWWNLPFDELLEAGRRDAGRIGWSLREDDGVLHGVINRGTVVDLGFDRPGLHDPGADLLKRRLQANWGAGAGVRHLIFERLAGETNRASHVIGAWRDASGESA